ncbi:hypothetical protein, partial [Lysinibacillus sp. NPDC056232]|uniref:hypothetical protein n=1 Tax=Lysinibacillus sp. NPDC056232 TaxID=3345756 RepID=UPI0035D78437
MQATYMIDPKVHRSLYQNAIKRFLETTISDYHEYQQNAKIGIAADYYYSKLLDKAIDDNKIPLVQVNDFLINELNYGLQRNLFIYLLQDTTHLEDKTKLITYINELAKFYENANLVKSFPFEKDITFGTERGKTKLVFADITEENNRVKSLRMVFSKGTFLDREELNYYIAIEINIETKILVIKLRGKNEQEKTSAINLNVTQMNFKTNILQKFKLESINTPSKIQKLVYQMTADLTNRVLSPAIVSVNAILEKEVDTKIKEWNKIVLDQKIELTKADYESIKGSILNNYYRLYMQNVIGKISNKELLEKYKVDGYVRAVKFVDDTIGEGKAKSSTTKESLLDTSVYYDVKTRLDQSKTIKYTTIYWINVPDQKDSIGT